MAIQLDSVNGITNATWTTGTRPSGAVAGQQGFNSTLGVLETYNGSTWAGSSFSPASPGPIGGTTANTATFTTLTATSIVEVSAASTAAIDVSTGDYFTITVTGATSFTVTNAAASPKVSSFILVVTNGGAGAVTWMSGTKWAGGSAPSLTSSGIDVLAFFTMNGGTTWYGEKIGLAYA